MTSSKMTFDRGKAKIRSTKANISYQYFCIKHLFLAQIFFRIPKMLLFLFYGVYNSPK